MLPQMFVELIALNVLLDAADQNQDIKNNFPLFLVPKAGQPGKYQCIADGKHSGQNDVCINDLCHEPHPPSSLHRGLVCVRELLQVFP